MNQLVFVKPGSLEWREVADARIQSDAEALVRPLTVGRCDLDLGFVRGLVPIPAGSPLGHECIGEVVEVGSRVRGVAVGQRVVVAAQISCGLCRMCRRGFTGRCEAVPFGASYGMGRHGDFGGALAELIRVPFADAMLVPVPEQLDPVKAIGIADRALDAWRAVAPHVRARPEAAVLIIGGLAQVIGIYSAGLAVALGAPRVDYWDDDEKRLAQAARFGAATLRMQTADPSGPYGIIVDARGESEALLAAIAKAEPEAYLTGVIGLIESTALPLSQMYHKGITFSIGRPNVRPPIEEAMRAFSAGHFHPEVVETSVHPFEDADSAFLRDDLSVVVSRL